jgi:hypothetical protein
MVLFYRVEVPNEPVNGNRKLNARVLRETSNLKEASGKILTRRTETSYKAYLVG